jgi:hypothetical protein
MKTTQMGRGRRNVGLFFVLTTFLLSVSSVVSAELPDRANASFPPELAQAMERDLGWDPARAEAMLRKEREAGEMLTRAKSVLGEHYAGSWIEHGADGEIRAIVATSSDQAGREAAASLGIGRQFEQAEIRTVRYSINQLDQAVDAFNRASMNPLAAGLDGVHSWGVDLRGNRVVVVTSPDVSERALEFFATHDIDLDKLHFEVSEHEPSTMVNVVGGFRYNSCSIGFAVRQGNTQGFVTAGHCGTVGTPVRINGITVGQYQRSDFPGADAAWANVRPSDSLYNLVWMYSGNSVYAVTNSGDAPLGATVCRSGFRTGWRCGTLTRNNVSVNYGSGMVYGLRESNACAGQGDSGGSWVAGGNQAQGVTSGGALGSDGTNCGIPQNQRRTWFQRLVPMLNSYGLSLVTN